MLEEMLEFIEKNPEEAKKAWGEASELHDYGVTCESFISEINEEEENLD